MHHREAFSLAEDGGPPAPSDGFLLLNGFHLYAPIPNPAGFNIHSVIY